jgi:hypothetical protein
VVAAAAGGFTAGAVAVLDGVAGAGVLSADGDAGAGDSTAALLGRSVGAALSAGPAAGAGGVLAVGLVLSLPGAAGESAHALNGASARTKPTAVEARNRWILTPGIANLLNSKARSSPSH